MISMEWMNLFGLYSCARYASTKENDYTVGKEFPNCIIVYDISKNSLNWVFRDNFIL